MVESIIDRINRQHYWTFHGGIHPPEQKDITNTKPIKHLALPKQLILPLQQHIGKHGDLLVNVGEQVLKGQPLTSSSHAMSVPIHAPTSGKISAIKPSTIAHPSGLSELCIFIDVDGKDTWVERDICQDISSLSHETIVKKISDAGISGMGGAGFPTHIKVNTQSDINFLIINAAECEPYITADDLLMCEQSEAIVDGIKIVSRLLNPDVILIGIEDNKPNAIAALQKATKNIEKIKVCVLPTKYPTGREKQLIKILTGKEVKSGALPIHDGIVVQNIATCFAINEAVHHGTPLIQRVVTLTGRALTKPQNVWALLGTPVNFLLEQCGFERHGLAKPPVIMGGPLMGFSLPNEQVPVIKTSNCILAPSKKEMPSAFEGGNHEVECIRCGQCADVCPSQLLPQEMQWSAKAKDYTQLEKLNLFDCIDCGACAYVCPSQIPLVHYYRVAKAEIRQQQQQDLQSERAKARFEARKLRLEKEKIARELKHKKAAEARKAAMNKATPEAVEAKSAVAAALARVKAKKAAAQKPSEQPVKAVESTNMVDDKKSQVAAAIARAKAKKAAKAPQTNDTGTSQAKSQSQEAEVSTKQDKKAQIAAAIAKAKAKKQQSSNVSTDSTPSNLPPETQEVQSSPADLKAKKAAAIAKAKAKALAKKQQISQGTSVSTDVQTNEIAKEHTYSDSTSATTKNADIKDNVATSTEKPEQTLTPEQAKKARTAAAIAKAKAKALAKKQSQVAGINPETCLTSPDEKQTNSEERINSSVEASTQPLTPEQEKKARAAAAIAKAKAKALARKKQSNPQATQDESQ